MKYFLTWKILGFKLLSNSRMRSVPSQTKPYPPISEVVKGQAIYEYPNVTATVVGFYFPSYLSGLTYPGFHLHFVTADAKKGGHVLDFEILDAQISLCPLNTYSFILPDYVNS